MKFAAFFRNLNLGHGSAPSRVVLEDLFLQAGAEAAASFQTNGTVAFDARGGTRRARSILRGVQTALQLQHGFVEPAFLRDMAHLAALVANDPFRGIACDAIYDFYVTFLHADAVVQPGLPLTNARGDVHVVAYAQAEMMSFNHVRGKSMGNPQVFAETLFGLPATTRTWGTVCRLVDKHG